MKIFLKRTAICFAIGMQVTVANAQNTLKIEEAILNDKKSYYHIDFKNYPKSLHELPIGVFDSGTGGLTVLDALVNYDNHHNETHTNKPDGKLDFVQEKFIYLADQANMPYGNYNAVGKDDLLKEHILKDFQFLFGKNYYNSSSSKSASRNKEQVKAIVIACNTATAYGYEEAMNFIANAGVDIPVVGVINAAVKGTLSKFAIDEDGSIAVFATVGTISSKGYERTLREEIKKNKYSGNIQIFNQGGHGLAEAVDEEPDFVAISATSPRNSYRGPSLSNDNYKIEKTLIDVYNFNFDKNKMLCNTSDVEDCDIMQLNDSENYVRYHLVSLVEKMRKSQQAEPLKALILGCTHYPYLIKEINDVLDELRNYQDKSGNYVYKKFIHQQVHIIDPSVYVASELYDILRDKNLFNLSGDMFKESKFYISVPNVDNRLVQLDEYGRFTYDYKYGRKANDIQEYVKVVPFDSNNISSGTYERFNKLIPNTYQMIRNSFGNM